MENPDEGLSQLHGNPDLLAFNLGDKLTVALGKWNKIENVSSKVVS